MKVNKVWLNHRDWLLNNDLIAIPTNYSTHLCLIAPCPVSMQLVNIGTSSHGAVTAAWNVFCACFAMECFSQVCTNPKQSRLAIMHFFIVTKWKKGEKKIIIWKAITLRALVCIRTFLVYYQRCPAVHPQKKYFTQKNFSYYFQVHQELPALTTDQF